MIAMKDEAEVSSKLDLGIIEKPVGAAMQC